MAERTVKFLGIRYGVEEEHPFQMDPNGNPLKTIQLRSAKFGDVVDIPRDEDLKRLEYYGAITTEEEQAELDATKNQTALEQLGVEAGSGSAQEFSAAGKSTEELGDWIAESRPTINELLEMAKDDPDLAEQLLDAENLATNNDPRAGLVTGLEKIMADRNS